MSETTGEYQVNEKIGDQMNHNTRNEFASMDLERPLWIDFWLSSLITENSCSCVSPKTLV